MSRWRKHRTKARTRLINNGMPLQVLDKAQHARDRDERQRQRQPPADPTRDSRVFLQATICSKHLCAFSDSRSIVSTALSLSSSPRIGSTLKLGLHARTIVVRRTSEIWW